MRDHRDGWPYKATDNTLTCTAAFNQNHWYVRRLSQLLQRRRVHVVSVPSVSFASVLVHSNHPSVHPSDGFYDCDESIWPRMARTPFQEGLARERLSSDQQLWQQCGGDFYMRCSYLSLRETRPTTRQHCQCYHRHSTPKPLRFNRADISPDDFSRVGRQRCG